MGYDISGEIADKVFGYVGKALWGTTKFAGKKAIGAYSKSLAQEEAARLKRQAALGDDITELEQQARWGNSDAQYEYGRRLFNYGTENEISSEREKGIDWIRKAAMNNHTAAQEFLRLFDF